MKTYPVISLLDEPSRKFVFRPNSVPDHRLPSVAAGRSKFQIFKPIIGSVMVNVVDYLMRFKFAAKVFLHNKSMLKHINSFTGSGHNIPSAYLPSPKPHFISLSRTTKLALSRAKNPLPVIKMGTANDKLFVTGGAFYKVIKPSLFTRNLLNYSMFALAHINMILERGC